jgi:hypothetical protein
VEHIGVIGTGVDLASLGALVSTAILPDGSALTVTDRDRIIISRNPDPAEWLGKAWTDAPRASGSDGTDSVVVSPVSATSDSRCGRAMSRTSVGTRPSRRSADRQAGCHR